MPVTSTTTTAIVGATTSCPNAVGANDIEGFISIAAGTFVGVTGLVQGTYTGDWADAIGLLCFRRSTGVVTNGGSTITLTDSTTDAYMVPAIEGLLAIRFLANGWTSGSCPVTVGCGVFGTSPLQPPQSSSFTSLTGTTLALSGNEYLADNGLVEFGTGTALGSGGDILMGWDGTRFNVTQLTTNSEIRWGVDGAGIDQRLYGDTASSFALWDQSADQLILGGVASMSGLRVATAGVTAITTTRAITKADSFGTFTAAQSSAYTITVAQPAGAGEVYVFQLVAPGAFDISLVATGCTFEGTITIDAATIPATGSTLKFVSGAAILGDWIELRSTSTTKFLVRAIGSGAGGITIS